MKRKRGEIVALFIVSSILIVSAVLFNRYLHPQPQPKPAPLFTEKKQQLEKKLSEVEEQQAEISTPLHVDSPKRTAARVPVRKQSAAATLPRFGYEGETVAGFTIPARMYVLTETGGPLGSSIARRCNQQWTNSPCYVEADAVRLRVFRCLDQRGFDPVDCQSQRASDQNVRWASK